MTCKYWTSTVDQHEWLIIQPMKRPRLDLCYLPSTLVLSSHCRLDYRNRFEGQFRIWPSHCITVVQLHVVKKKEKIYLLTWHLLSIAGSFFNISPFCSLRQNFTRYTMAPVLKKYAAILFDLDGMCLRPAVSESRGQRQELNTTYCRNARRFHRGCDRALDKVSFPIAIEKWLKPVRTCHTDCNENSFGNEHGIDPALILATSHGRRTIDIVHQWKPELANMDCKSWPDFVTASQPQPRPQEETVSLRHTRRGTWEDPKSDGRVPGFDNKITSPDSPKKKKKMIVLHNYYSVTNAPRCSAS